MAAQGCRYTRVAAALRSNLPVLVVCAGLISLIHDSWPTPLPHRGNFPALFGVLLWLWVVERFHERLRAAPRVSMTDLRSLSRRLSRRVYLLLYGLMLVHLVVDLCAAAHHLSLQAPRNFQGYLICGVLALLTIHLLAAWGRHLVAAAAAEPPLDLLGNGRLT